MFQNLFVVLQIVSVVCVLAACMSLAQAGDLAAYGGAYGSAYGGAYGGDSYVSKLAI
jgi:hypothetical protein